MEIEKFEKQMRLLELLIANQGLRKESICNEIGISPRTMYRYLELFEDAGFNVQRGKESFGIDPSSPFIANITKHSRLKPSDLNTIHSLIENANSNQMSIRNLKASMRSIYGMEFSDDAKGDKTFADNTNLLLRAIAEKRKVVLREYYSPHSQTTSDRLVEPYKMLLNNLEVRCYEIASGKCKTFKVARIRKRLDLLEAKWEHEGEHTNYYTDLWGFSGETTYRVKLKLGYLAMRLLIEEYGVSEYQFVILDDKHWLFSTNVCSFQGIGRFVMGLITDIEVIDSTEFKRYLAEILQSLTKRGFFSLK